MKTYPPEAFIKLCETIQNEDGKQEWFTSQGYPELWEFWNAIDDDERSFKWLMDNHFPELAAVVDAINGNTGAKKWLLMNRFRELAAFVDAIDGSQPAISFLLQADEKGWLSFAQVLYKKYQKKDKNIFSTIFNFGNPYGS